jgi:hypothetical protein
MTMTKVNRGESEVTIMEAYPKYIPFVPRGIIMYTEKSQKSN